jgi:uracil-DNA glycosylase
LIGEAPGRAPAPDGPLGGRCGRRLADLAGLSFEAYLGAVERRNLLPRNPGRAGAKGDAFPMREARARAWAFARSHAGRRAILLGRRVAAAFGRPDALYLIWSSLAPFSEAMIFPHPSGVNRWWNARENVLSAREVLRAAL